MTATMRSLSRGTVARYATGSIGTGGFATLPGLVLVFYLTDTLGVGALAAGAVITAAKVWDVLIDPVIGRASDRALAARGSRRGLMVIGALALPVFFVATFAVPAGLPPAASALWVFVAFLATATAFSLFQVPYIALPAEIGRGYDDRTRLLTWRVVVLSVAILAFGAGGPMLRDLGGDEYGGYLTMGLVAGVVIAAGLLVASTTAPRGVVVPLDADTPRVRDAYRAGIAALRRSQSFRALLGAFLLQGLATGLMLAGANYVAVWVLKDDAALTFLFVALIGPAILGAPVWGVIARRIGKERAFVIASALFAVACLLLVGLLWSPGGWVYAPVALAGVAYAGMQSLPMAMLPDVIAVDAAENGDGQAGIFGGVWTAGETTGMALGATLLTIVLAVTGYTASVAGEVSVQSSEAVTGIALAFSLIPALLVVTSIAVMNRYRLRRADIEGADAAPVGVSGTDDA